MLDTLANVKTALLVAGTTDDATLTKLLEAADAFISAHTGRAFEGGAFTETHPGGARLVFLRNYPVDVIDSVRVDANRLFATETIRAATGYVVHADRGVIESLDGPFLPPRPGRTSADWPGAVQVTYSTPTAVPAAVKEAFAQLVGHWYALAKTGEDLGHVLLTEFTDTSGTKTYPWALAGGPKVPAGVLRLLAPYRAPTL